MRKGERDEHDALVPTFLQTAVGNVKTQAGFGWEVLSGAMTGDGDVRDERLS